MTIAVALLCLLIESAIYAVPLDLTNQVATIARLDAQQAVLIGTSELHLTDSVLPLVNNATIGINSDRAVVVFDNIKPEIAISRWLSFLSFNGAKSAIDSNCKVVENINGSLVFAHGKNFKPLYLFDAPDLKGKSDTLGIGLFTTGTPKLGTVSRSFFLKRGFCASFAQNKDGTGVSGVFIADTSDIAYNFPTGLAGSVALIRVAEFRCAGKKGVGGGTKAQRDIFNPSNFYDWGLTSASSLNTQFIPMVWGKTSATTITSLSKRVDINQALAFNEPDNPIGQSGQYGSLYMTDTAVDNYRYFLASGLRLGSPAVTDNDRGWKWLDTFMTKTSQKNYRVDFITVHYYQKNTASGFYSKLKSLYTAYKLPIWVTEFNYAASWTTLPTDSTEYFRGLKAYIDMLDTCPFIEHYFVYPWWGAGDSVLSIFKTETPPARSLAGTWFSEKPDYYGYNSSLINKIGQPIALQSRVITPQNMPKNQAFFDVNFLLGNRGTSFTLRLPGHLSFEIFTFSGKKILALPPKNFSGGKHLAPLLFAGISPGTYIVRYTLNGMSGEKKITAVER